MGFGFDSAIEVSAALILAWRLHRERREGCMQADDHRATRAIAVSFAILAVYVGVGVVPSARVGFRTRRQRGRHRDGQPLAGAHAVAGARQARRWRPPSGSAAAVADAKQTNLCALLSGVLLVGLSANAVLGWWWADPLAGLAIAAIALAEARRTWTAESLEDTCCA